MDAKQHIDQAFKIMRKIPVCEENVDLMFMAKEELRSAYKLLENTPEPKNTKNKEGVENG